MKTLKLWGGFVDGKLHVWPKGTPWAGEVSVYSSRVRARKQYEDVRRIEVRVAPRHGRQG